MAALPTTIPAAPSMLGADDAAKQEYFQALQKTLDALEARANQGPNMYQIAGALFDPGRTGHAGEAVGRVANVVGAQQERLQDLAIPMSQMKLQIAGQKYEIENQAKALKLLADTLGMTEPQVAQSLQTGSFPPGSATKLAQVYPIISQLSPKVGEIVKNTFGMQKDLATLATEQRKAGMGQAELEAKYGKGILDLIPGGGIPTTPVPAAPPAATTPPPAVAPPVSPAVTPNVPTVSPMSAMPVDKMKQALIDNAAAKATTPAAPPVPPPPRPTMLGSADVAPAPSSVVGKIGTTPDIKLAQNTMGNVNTLAPTPDSDLSKLPLASQAAITETRVKEADKPWIAKRDELINYTPQLLEQSSTNLRHLDYLASKHPDVFGLMLRDPGLITGLLKAAQAGASLSVNDYNIKASLPVTDFLQGLTLPRAKQQIVRDVSRILSSEFLSNVKANKGLLGVNPTDNDARLLQAPMASIEDTSKAMQLWARNQLLMNKERGALFNAYQDHLDKVGAAAAPASFFRRNSVYDKINKDYSIYRQQLFNQFNQ